MEDREIKAMSRIAEALADLGEGEEEVVRRILRWAGSRYGVRDEPSATRQQSEGQQSVPLSGGRFATAADLFDAVDPQMEFEKAITIGYWFQSVQGQPDFGGQEVNSTLKNIGHGIVNITDAFNTAMGRKPSLVIQTQKTGSSKQARKQYKLTVAGTRWVEARLSPATNADSDQETVQS